MTPAPSYYTVRELAALAKRAAFSAHRGLVSAARSDDPEARRRIMVLVQQDLDQAQRFAREIVRRDREEITP